MRAGKLRHRVEVQAATQTQAADGDTLSVWSTLAFRWASVEAAGGGETTKGGAVVADVTHKVTMRGYPGLTGKQRLLWKGRVLNVEGVADAEGRGRETVLQCREVTS